MAKICFLIDRLPSDPDPFSYLMWNQMRVLAEGQHDVLVVTHRHQILDAKFQHPRLQVIEPFKGWSIRHLPSFLKVLAFHKPDVLHWVEPREKSVAHLQWVTPAIAALPKRPLLVMSLWDPRAWQPHWLLTGSLQAMDILFVTHPSHRELLWNRWPHMISKISLAPLLFDFSENSSHWLTAWGDDFELLPAALSEMRPQGNLLDALMTSLMQNPERKAIIPMSDPSERFLFLEKLRNADLDARVALFESLDWPTWNYLFAHAREIRGDLVESSSPYLSMALQWTAARSRSIRLASDQKALLPEMQWQDSSNFLSRAYQSALRNPLT